MLRLRERGAAIPGKVATFDASRAIEYGMIVVSGLCIGVLALIFAQSAAAAEAIKYKEKTLYSFCSAKNCADGANPTAALIDVNGTLYGTTGNGGQTGCQNYGCGTVFSVNPATGAESVLYSFCTQQNCTDGANPFAGLINAKGSLIGTTAGGGSVNCFGGCGTAFQVNPTTGSEKVLYAFCKEANCDDGDGPLAGLIDAGGKLYGTTQGGGTGQSGTAFVIDPKSGKETVLHSFCSAQNCADGQNPNAALIDLNGTLYGTTNGGGANCSTCGTAFSIDPSGGTEEVLYSFCGQNHCADGRSSDADLIAVNGLLYGTTYGGGVAGYGTVFSIDPNTGVEKVLHSFCSRRNCADGANPWAGLIYVKGTLYGATQSGGGIGCGGPGCGTVFSINPNTGKETVLYSFSGGVDGADPVGGLIEVKGTLYGTAGLGGNQGCGGNGCGTVFALHRER